MGSQQQQQENSTHQVANMAVYEPVWYLNGQGGIVHGTGNDWRDVILPAIPLSHLYTQQMSYLIHGLEPDRKYEAKVQARLVKEQRRCFIVRLDLDNSLVVSIRICAC